ncbi:hypothetical protein Tco_0481340 [Tanacetum coccineum]
MAGPITKEYIFATSKSFISNDTNGKMIEKNFIEIEGTFLLKIRDNTFHRNKGEDVFKHINSFVEVVEPLKIRGLSHDRFRLSDDLVEKFVLKFYNLCKHEEHEETNDENDPDVSNDVPEIFKINGGLFHFDTPLCIAFEEFNHLLKIDPDLFTYEIPKRSPKQRRKFDILLVGKLTSKNFHRRYEYEVLVTTGDMLVKGKHSEVRRFEMMKYSFNNNEDYMHKIISEPPQHSKDSSNAYSRTSTLIMEKYGRDLPPVNEQWMCEKRLAKAHVLQGKSCLYFMQDLGVNEPDFKYSLIIPVVLNLTWDSKTRQPLFCINSKMENHIR